MARSTAAMSAEFAAYRELSRYSDAVCPPPGLEMCCPPRAPISEQDLFGIYREFVQLRQERQECELNPRDACLALPFSPSPAPIEPPRANNKLEGNTTLDLQSLSAPQRPPGVFLKSRSRDSLQTVSTIATLTGDIEDSLVSNATAAAVDVKGNPCEEAPGAAKSGSEVQCDLRMEHLGKDGHRKVIWHVHASKLRSKDQQIISSTFEIAGCCFKLMLKPTPMGDKKRAGVFQEGKGLGFCRSQDGGGCCSCTNVMFLRLCWRGIHQTSRPA